MHISPKLNTKGVAEIEIVFQIRLHQLMGTGLYLFPWGTVNIPHCLVIFSILKKMYINQIKVGMNNDSPVIANSRKHTLL